GRDPTEAVTSRDRARARVRVHTRCQHRAEIEPEGDGHRSAHRQREFARHPDEVTDHEAHRAQLASQEHDAHLEVVVHLVRRLVLDEPRELHRRWRRDHGRAEADVEWRAHEAATLDPSAAERYAASTTATAARPSAAVTDD